MASHAHVDHVGALDPILSSGSPVLASVVTVYRSVDGWNADRRWLDRYHTAINNLGAAVKEVTLRDAHREVELAPNVVAHLFAGSGDGPYTALFMQLRYHSARLLFTSDAHCQYEIEQLEAVGDPDFRADVLKVTHHGSSSGTALRTVRSARHAFAIASTGDDAGHRLEQDTLERLTDGNPRRRVFEKRWSTETSSCEPMDNRIEVVCSIGSTSIRPANLLPGSMPRSYRPTRSGAPAQTMQGAAD